MKIAIALAFGALLSAPQGGKWPPQGRWSGEIKDPVKKDTIMRVSMWAPQRMPPTRSLSLLLVHHGMNGNENNYIGGTIDAYQRANLLESYVIISGKSKGPGWAKEDDDYTIRLIDWAKQNYPIDPRRVYIWGSSNGAGFIGRFGWEHQELVAGAIGYCGGYNFAKDVKAEKPWDTRTEWYFVHGGNDNPGNSRNGCNQLKAKGYRYVFRQLDGYGHTDIWDGQGHPDMTVVDAIRDDWVAWLETLRHKEIEPTAKEKERLGWFENKSKAESMYGSKATFFELTRIGGPLAAPAVLQALQWKGAGVRAAAAEACGRHVFSRAVLEELGKLVNDPADNVQRLAIHALGSAAAFNYEEAEQALVTLALTKAATGGPTVADRAAALEAIGRAVKHAFLGNFEDAKPLFWALVQCLDDDEGRIRGTAFAILAKASKDGFGYNPGLSGQARKDAVAKWAAWCTQKCGAHEGKAAGN